MKAAAKERKRTNVIFPCGTVGRVVVTDEVDVLFLQELLRKHPRSVLNNLVNPRTMAKRLIPPSFWAEGSTERRW